MNCLYCYKPLADGEVDYHKSCARKIFESTTVPVLPYTRANIKELAREIVSASTTVTGVQAKLSLDITRGMPESRNASPLSDYGDGLSSNLRPTVLPIFRRMKT